MMAKKLLFRSKIARPNILEAVELIMTRVKGQYMFDYKKLDWVIKYLRVDPETPLTLEADNANFMNGGMTRSLMCT